MKLPRVTGWEVVKALQRKGFQVVRSKGSHFHLYHPDKDVLVTVPVHASKTLAPKTLKSILKAAQISLEELQEAL